MPYRRPISKEQILLAMEHTKSNRAGAKFLNCSYTHYKKYAKLYREFEGGRTLFEIHKNIGGKGIPKLLLSSSNGIQADINDIISGTISPSHFSPDKIKKRLVEEGYLKEECYNCGYHERRLLDYKIPLILSFKNKNTEDFHLSNVEFLCYNCYFINVGNIFNKNEVIQLETHVPKRLTTDAINFELDEFQLEKLRELGLNDTPKVEETNDGSEFISRI